MVEHPRLICRSEDLQDGGTGVRFELSWQGETTPAFAVRHAGKVHAYLNRCGHVPVQLDWQPGEFFDHSQVYLICATHGALYAPDSGRCMGGRCNGQGLQALPVSEHDGVVYLLTNETTI
jgi:nitrite reductase/ring-hydroxylating ferredoxin subunit